MADQLVITPGGFRPNSMVHEIAPGHVLDTSGDRIREMDRTGKLVTDHGPLTRRPGNKPLMPANVTRETGRVPGLGTGWIIDASWTNNTGKTLTSFTTTWTVPPAPATSSGQVIFLFSGVQNSTMIYQPVLQWGSSAAGGGNNWAVASWYVDGQGGPGFHSPLVPVNTGDVLVGIMTLTGQSGANFSYNCQFQGIPSGDLADPECPGAHVVDRNPRVLRAHQVFRLPRGLEDTDELDRDPDRRDRSHAGMAGQQ